MRDDRAASDEQDDARAEHAGRGGTEEGEEGDEEGVTHDRHPS
jgi:hypothetical protein